MEKLQLGDDSPEVVRTFEELMEQIEEDESAKPDKKLLDTSLDKP